MNSPGGGHAPPVMVGDAGYGEIRPFRTGLTDRQIPYVVQFKASTGIHDADAVFIKPPPKGEKGQPAKAVYHDSPAQA